VLADLMFLAAVYPCPSVGRALHADGVVLIDAAVRCNRVGSSPHRSS
jgi:hypothetical protein